MPDRRGREGERRQLFIACTRMPPSAPPPPWAVSPPLSAWRPPARPAPGLPVEFDNVGCLKVVDVLVVLDIIVQLVGGDGGLEGTGGQGGREQGGWGKLQRGMSGRGQGAWRGTA